MASLRSKFYSAILRRFLRGSILPEGEEGVRMMRERMASGSVLGPIMRTRAQKHSVTINGCHADWHGDPSASHTLLYLHGGGYMIGSHETHRGLVAQICKFAGIRALVLNYRKAPEDPFPAAIEDAEAAYDFLVEQEGLDPKNMFVAGDSAGGGLSLALMLTLKEKGKTQPKAAALLSPWTDLTISGRSHKERDQRDPMIDVSRMSEAIDMYRGSAPADHPKISPLFADLSGLPPMLVQVGTEEVLFDDSTRLVENAKAAGVAAELEVWEDMPHVHQIAYRLVPEAKAALRNIAAYFVKQST
jgi:acetyl esterase/lipase